MMLCSVENQFVLEKWSVFAARARMAHPAPALPWETLSSGAEPSTTHPAGDGRGGGSPVGDILSWDTYLHVLAVL